MKPYHGPDTTSWAAQMAAEDKRQRAAAQKAQDQALWLFDLESEEVSSEFCGLQKVKQERERPLRHIKNYKSPSDPRITEAVRGMLNES